jgi:hypothetical protein
MDVITVDMKWIRAVATWQPVTKNVDNTFVLEGVNVMVEGDSVIATVTDRYRIVYSVSPNAGDTTVTGVNVIVPMSMIVSFATANKNIDNGMPVTIEVVENVTRISCFGAVISGDTVRGQYPRTYSLVQEWQPTDEGGGVMFNMKLLADVVKFANPIEGVVTAARRDDKWNATRGGSSGGTWRFDKGNPDVFGVIVQSPKRV